MNEETKGPEEAPTVEKPPLREEELAQVLKAHLKWVESGGWEGERADLRRGNLQGAILYKANLQNALLIGANLQGAQLFRTNLQGADLEGAKLQGAYLNGANLQEANFRSASLEGANLIEADVSGADLTEARLQGAKLARVKGLAEATLQNANLEGATGLLGTEFARGDVTGAKLPEDIREFKLLETVAETSKNARKIFFAMLLGCAYSLLTIATTTDARLLTDSPTSPLPIIQTEIPIAWFYLAAPLVLLGLYIYLHFHLRKLWEGLAGLPAIFEDGKRLDQRAYPWLLNGLVRRHFERLRKSRPFLVWPEEWTIIFLAWWTVPATLFWFWLQYLPRHHWAGTWWLIGLLVASVLIGIMFYRSAARTLRGAHPAPFGWKTFWDRRTFQATGIPLLGVLLWGISFGAIEGIGKRFRGDNPDWADFASTKEFLQTLVPWAFEKVGYSPFADLVEAELSLKPDNWTGIAEGKELDAQIAQVKKARLSGMDLRYASAEGAFLVKADLAYANLQGAHLVGANLQGADLSGAKLQGANLQFAYLKRAELLLANLEGASLVGANLGGVNLINTRGLTKQQLDFACGDENTKLPPGMKIKTCPQEKKQEKK